MRNTKPTQRAQRPTQKRKHSREQIPKESNALIRIPAPPDKPWNITQDERTLIKNHVAKGASDEELTFCLTVARRYRLDPFRGQIWFVKRNDRSAEGGARWIPIVGINGLLHVAARDHRDFGSIEEPEYGPMIEIPYTKYWWDNGQKKSKHDTMKAPEWARVRAWKKGLEHPIVATVYFEEIYPSVDNAPMVRQMPRHMLGKCATAHVVRKGWPGTDGLYIREEFQGPPDYTEGGRRIVRPEPADADVIDAPLDENAAHGHMEGSRKAEIAQNTLAAVEEEDRRLAEEQAAKKPKADPKPLNLEIDLTNPEDPILRGDTPFIIPLVEKHIKATWRDDWYHVRPEDVATLYAASRELKFTITEFPSQGKGAEGKGEAKSADAAQTNPSAPKSKKKEDSKSTNPTVTTTGASAGGPSSASPALVEGTITHSVAGMAGKTPVRDVTMFVTASKKKPTFRCFDKGLFEWLDRGVGKESAVLVKQTGKYWNLTGLRRIGSQEFEQDGKTPAAIQVDREPGALFK